jgi:hypothetical protein
MHKNKYRMLIAVCIVGLALSLNTSFSNDASIGLNQTNTHRFNEKSALAVHFVLQKLNLIDNLTKCNYSNNTPSQYIAIINGGSM